MRPPIYKSLKPEKKKKGGYKWENPTLLEGKRPISIVALKGGYKKLSFVKFSRNGLRFFPQNSSKLQTVQQFDL